MAGIKISQLDSGGSVASTDQIPVARDGVNTLRIPASQFVTDGTNVGVGQAQFFSDKLTAAGSTLKFRTLSADEGLSVKTVGDTVVISASGQNPSKTSFISNGSTTTWPVNDAKSINANNYRVTIDGVVQEPLVDYTINGSNIVFSDAPPLSGNVVVVSNNLVRAYDIIPSDGSVTTNKLALSAVTTATINNGAVTFEKLVTTLQQALLPAGAVQPFAMNVAPSGWLAANGSAVSRTTYAALFAAIGTTYGSGDGSTTFTLPDLRGYFIRGTGTNSDGSTAGTFGAKQEPSWKSFYMWNAYGPATTYDHGPVYMNKYLTNPGNVSPLFGGGWSSPAARMGLYWDNSEIRPANVALLYCIKT